MWISGPVGVGKSAILQTVCEELTGESVLDLVGNEEQKRYVAFIAVMNHF